MWLKCCVFFIFAVFVNNAVAAGNCVIDYPGWENKEISIYFNDTDTEGTTKEYEMENIKEIEMDETYLTYEITEDKLIFSVTKQFEKYVELEDDSLHPIEMKLTCEDDTVVDFVLNFQVLDTTQRKPEFTEKSYKFKLVLPIVANSIVENVKIEAKDINLGDELLTFSVTDVDCGKYFEFTKSTKDFKTYSTFLKAKRVINQLDESLSCSIEVQDKDKLQDTATMDLEVDTTESQPPNPIFKKPLYEATYTDDNEIEMDSVELVDTFFEPTFEIFPEEYKIYFEFDNTIKKLKPTETPLPDNAFDDKNYIAITIQATYEKAQHPGMTIVNINSPNKKVDPIPAFEEPLYEIDANDDNTIEPKTVVLKSTTADAPTVKIEPDYQEFFKWEKNILFSIKPLPKETFESVNYISVTIEAYYDKNKDSGRTVVIINSPAKDPIPVFEKPLYETVAKDDNTIDPITIDFYPALADAPTVEIEPDYQEFFKWEKNTLSSTKSLPKETFESDNYISVTVEAYYDKSKSSDKTVVIINSPTKDPIPAFEKLLYETDAKDDNTIEPITIDFNPTLADAPIVEIEPEYQEFFKWEKNTVSSIKSLPKETFESDNYISVTIEAYYDKSKGSGKTIVIINSPAKDPIPVFENPLYETVAKDDNTIDPITIDFNPALVDAPTVEIEPDYQEFFKWEKNTLSSIKSLPKETFETDNYISVTIEAYYVKSKGSGRTVVIINAPEEDEEVKDQIPVFEKPLYETVAKDDNTIEPITIDFNPALADAPTVEIEPDYQEFFKWEKNTLSSIKSLPKETFESDNYISVTIEAYYVKSKGSGRTVVIINAPEEDEEVKDQIPVFEKPLYETVAKDDNTIEPITIDFNPALANAPTVEIEPDYQEFFKWEKNTLSSIKSLPKETFESDNYISVTIEAYYVKSKGSGRTVVIINAPEEDEEVKDQIPVFKKPLYETVAKDDNTIEPITIDFNPALADAPTVEIEPDYQEFFKWEKNTLSSIKSLPKETFVSDNYISVTIEAYYVKSKGSGRTVVIINAPEEDEEVKDQIPVFEKPLYETVAKDDNTIEPITIDFNPTLADAPTVEIEPDYQEFFKWEKNTLSSIKSLPKETFESDNYISVTIEAYYVKSKGSGRTVVIINAPEEDEEVKDQIPVFEKPLYEIVAKDDNTIEPITIDFNPTLADAPTVEIEPDYQEFFKWEKNTLSSIKSLPKETFESDNYISVTIEAYYVKSKGSGRTVVIINAPEEDEEVKDQIPVFEKPLYKIVAKDDNTIEPLTIDFNPTLADTPTVDIEPNYQEFFKWEKNTLSSTKSLPKETFESDNYISVTIEAYYDKSKGSGKTVVIINAPEKNDDQEEKIPEFENPFYRTQYKNDDTMDPLTIKLKSSSPTTIFEIEAEYANNFKLEDDKFELIQKLPENTFEEVHYITVTIYAFYDKSKRPGKTVVIIDSPKQTVLKPQVWYEEKLAVFDKEHTFTGVVGKFTANSENDEDILYEIVQTDPDIKDKLEYKQTGELIVKEELYDTVYFQITLRAKGKDTSSEDKMDVVLIFNDRVNDDSKFKYSLIVEAVDEHSAKETIIDAQGTTLEIIDKVSTEWFEIDDTTGNLLLKANIDRENDKLKNMLKSQVTTKIRAVDKSTKNLFKSEFNNSYHINLRNDQKCIDISSIPYERDIMHVVVTIEDVNDNKPKFIQENPLIIGYPNSELSEFIAPPYLVKVTAIDEDIGINAKIQYSVDKNFKIDSENGIIYPGDDLSSDTEFTVTATDKDGANDGNKTPLKIKVKILEEKHITILTLKNIAFSEVDDFITNIGKETNTKVRYLTSTALPNSETAEENTNLRLTRADDKLPVLRIVMYALDNDNVVLAADFIKLIEESSISKLVEVKQYVIPTGNDEFKFEHSLFVEAIDENSAQTTIVKPPEGTKLEIIDTDKDSKEWFKIDDTTGNLVLKANIDREDDKLKNMLKSQVTTQIRAVDKSTKNSFKSEFNNLYQINPRNDQKCIDISSIPYERDIMHVVVTIEDVNDNEPKFDEENPLIIGYPNNELAEFIAPPYLVKVTATDEDIGINAKIRYSVDKNFKIDSENGIIYPGDDLSSDTEFTVTATDKDGAEDGYKTPLKIKVKILEEKHITIVTMKNIAFSEVDDLITNIGKETNTKVRYLTSTALPNSETEEEKANLRLTRADDKLPVLRIVMYALDNDNDNVVLATDFQKLIEESDLSESVEVKHYVTPSNEESDDSGWVAAVSTLSVLLGLVIIGVIVGYIFYIRPRLLSSSIKYEKHTNRDSLHVTPVENKLDTKISDRRPTGFPVGFTPKDVDDDDYEDLESVKEEKLVEVDDVFEESETSKPEPERKKSVVKFDVNVTEIEISEL